MTDNVKKKLLGKYGEDYVRALLFTMQSEGAFSFHKADKGAMTYKGIARVYNSKWSGWVIIDKVLEKYPELKVAYTKPPASIHKLNFELNVNEDLEMLVYDFYYENYYTKCGAWNIGGKLAVVLFDISILQGVKRAVKTLQRLLNRYYNANLVVDGDFGKSSLNALLVNLQNPKIGEEELTSQLLLEMTDNLVEASKINDNATFLAGWMKRTQNLRNYLRLL